MKKTERWCPDPMPSTIALWVNLVGVDCSLTQPAISPPIVSPELFEHKINSITQPGPEKINIRL